MGEDAHPAGVMSRASRFDKLETVRSEKEATNGDEAIERRFAIDAPATAGVEEKPEPPAAEVARVNSEAGPEATTKGLQRFEVDGAQHVSLDTDELARLPFRRCVECQRDSSKFDTKCIFCGASLETAEAQALNLELLATFDATRKEADAALVAQHQAGIQEIVEREVARHEEEARLASEGLGLKLRAGLGGSAAVCLLLALVLRSFCPSLFFITVGVALLVAALPVKTLQALSAPVRSRFRL